MFSDTFGVKINRYSDRRDASARYSLTTSTREYPHVVRLLNRYFEDNHSLPVTNTVRFPYTSISLNKAYAARRHRDQRNEGPSMAKALGSFSMGGRLGYWREDHGAWDVMALPIEKRVWLDAYSQFQLFDGGRAHEVEPFKGERFSLVFFPVNVWTRVLF